MSALQGVSVTVDKEQITSDQTRSRQALTVSVAILSPELTCVVVWLVATLTGEADVDCCTARICWPSATFTGSATDFWEALEVGEATDTTVT